MKVAMLLSTPFPPEEGIGNYVQSLSNELLRQGHEVIIITRGGLRKQVLEYGNSVIYKLPFLMLYPFQVDVHKVFVSTFLKAFEKKDLDLVHVHLPLTAVNSIQTPIVTTFHTPLYSDSRLLHASDAQQFLIKILGLLSYRVEKSLVASSKRISAVSEGVAFDLARYYGLKRRDIAVLGNAPSDLFVEAGRFFSASKNEKRILYAGRLDKQKGILDLIESMKTVCEKIPDAKLVMVGKGPALSAVARRVIELNLQKHVELAGFKSHKELLDIYSRSSIYVQPSSYSEGLPTSILEAMACKLAVVATSVRGVIDIVKQGETGMLVPPKDPKSLATAIIDLLNAPDLVQKIGANGRRVVENKFTWKKVAERVLAAYRIASG
jgi:glycosyltransferase involved in cell wall biosynthesis